MNLCGLFGYLVINTWNFDDQQLLDFLAFDDDQTM